MGDKDYIMWSERQKMAFEQVGIEKGDLRRLVNLVLKKIIKNNAPEEIADMLEEDLTEITKICDTAAKYAPDYDVDRIVDELLATK